MYFPAFLFFLVLFFYGTLHFSARLFCDVNGVETRRDLCRFFFLSFPDNVDERRTSWR